MWANLLALFTALGGVGAFTAAFRAWRRFRGNPALARHQEARTDSLTATATIELLAPIRSESAHRLQRITDLKSILRRLLAHHDAVVDCAEAAHITDLPAMPVELRIDIDRELE